MSSPTPLVSIVLPAFNPGPFLEASVLSVIAQSETSWELIVVDDGGAEDVSWVVELDPRIRLVRERPGGVSVARNHGIAASRGQFVAFIDQDDQWRTEKLGSQTEAIERSELAFSYSQFDLLFDGTGERRRGYGREVQYLDVIRGEMGVLLSSLLVRRSALDRVGGFHPLLRMQQDLDLTLRLLRDGPGSYLEDPLVTYRLHELNASKDCWQAAREMAVVLSLQGLGIGPHDERAGNALKEGRARTRRTYAEQALDLARERWRAGARSDAVAALASAARLDKAAPFRFVERAVRARLGGR